jgi:Protein of unknown function (DUF3108)
MGPDRNRRHRRTPLNWLAGFFGLFVLVTFARAEISAPWLAGLTTQKKPGAFTALENASFRYKFGWLGLKAGEGDVQLIVQSDGTLKAIASGGTTGWPRSLFKLDVTHECTANRSTFLPIHVSQDEKYASEDVQTTIDFNSRHVVSLRVSSKNPDSAKPRDLDYSPVFSLETAFLWVRSQPLTTGELERMVVWANNSGYLATIRVVGREKLRFDGEDRNTIKLDLELQTIDKNLELKKHKLFRSGRGWLSDDALRIPLRVEADIFIGSVFAELESYKLGG